MVERGELAGDVKRLVVGGGNGADQADALCDRADRRQERERLQAADNRVRRSAPGGKAIRQEDRVELGALGDLRQFLVVAYICYPFRVRVGGGARRPHVCPTLIRNRFRFICRLSALICGPLANSISGCPAGPAGEAVRKLDQGRRRSRAANVANKGDNGVHDLRPSGVELIWIETLDKDNGRPETAFQRRFWPPVIRSASNRPVDLPRFITRGQPEIRRVGKLTKSIYL